VKVQPVSVEHVAQVWPKVVRFISSALKYSSGDYTADQARVYLSLGTWSMIVAVDDESEIKGVTVIQYINRPNDRVAFIIAIGGKLISDPDTWSNFTDLLRFNGATKVEGAARKSIARLWAIKFNFTEKYRIVEVSL
jgi:hypothetical protein